MRKSLPILLLLIVVISCEEDSNTGINTSSDSFLVKQIISYHPGHRNHVKYVFDYKDNNVTTIKKYSNKRGNDWKLFYSTIVEYSENKITAIQNQKGLDFLLKTEYVFEDGLLKSETDFYEDNSQWFVTNGTEFEYSIDGLILKETNFSYNWENEYTQSKKSEYVYRSDTLVEKICYYYEEDDWEIGRRWSYEYSGDILSLILQKWYPAERDWLNETQYNYYYSGQTKSYVNEKYWIPQEDTWSQSYRITFEYDKNGNLISKESETRGYLNYIYEKGNGNLDKFWEVPENKYFTPVTY